MHFSESIRWVFSICLGIMVLTVEPPVHRALAWWACPWKGFWDASAAGAGVGYHVAGESCAQWPEDLSRRWRERGGCPSPFSCQMPTPSEQTAAETCLGMLGGIWEWLVCTKVPLNRPLLVERLRGSCRVLSSAQEGASARCPQMTFFPLLKVCKERKLTQGRRLLGSCHFCCGRGQWWWSGQDCHVAQRYVQHRCPCR